MEVFRNYANERRERQRLESVVEQQTPKVEFADAVLAANQSITMKHMAALLKKNGVNVGRSRLFKLLRNDGYLCKLENLWNVPMQAALEAGYFTVTECHYTIKGERKLSFVTRVTPQGSNAPAAPLHESGANFSSRIGD